MDLRRHNHFYYLSLWIGLFPLLNHSDALARTPELQVRLHQIQINGAEHFTTGRLIDLTGLVEGRKYAISRLTRAREELERKMSEQNGFPFATITSYKLHFNPDSSFTDLEITIDEGLPVIVDSVGLSGSISHERREHLRNLLRTKEGEYLTASEVAADLETIVDNLEREGHPFAKASTQLLIPDFQPDRVGVRLELGAYPGRVVRIEQIKINGLKHTDIRLVKRILHYPIGERYNPRNGEASRLRLMRTNWFSQVDLPLLYRDVDGKFGIIYNVEEQPTSQVSGAMGYMPEAGVSSGVAGGVDIVLDNLLGTGRRFDFHWQRDDIRHQAFALRYKEPFIFGSSFNLEGFIEQEVEESLYVALGFGVGSSVALGQTLSLIGRFARKMITADSLATGEDSISYNLYSAALIIEVDSRDSRINPTQGSFARLKTERYFSSSQVGTPGANQRKPEVGNLQKNGVDFEHLIPLKKRLLGFFGIHYLETRSSSGKVPYSEWSRIGGSTSVRGYLENSLKSPRAGWINFECRLLTGVDSRVFLLTDGAVLDAPAVKKWHYSYGFGGVIKAGGGWITLAVALPDGEEWSAMVLHTQLLARF